MTRFILRGLTFAIAALFIVPTFAQQKPFKIPPANLDEQIIWGSTCDGPDGFVLGFGGQDQKSDELPRTRIKVDGQWKSMSEELRKKNPLQMYHDRCQKLAHAFRGVTARCRYLNLQGHNLGELPEALEVELKKISEPCRMEWASLAEDLKAAVLTQEGYEKQQLGRALPRIKEPVKFTAALILDSAYENVALEQAGVLLDAQPPARFLSPLAYDAKTKLFVLIAGDHGDYLTNDIWLFDPAKMKWEQRHPASAPPPRGGHTLKANGDGVVTLSGGYTYTSSISYLGAQYKELSDGDWTYDIAANTWKGSGQGVPPHARVYRTGPFNPDYFLKGAKPDAAATKQELDAIGANRWVERKPPHKPEMVRTWGHAVLDPDHDLVLIFSGGHSAHCGSDVLHYHLATNRWELTSPVEFPLGQTYSNTSYPEGYNLNKRPWVTGHTYQSYNYDPLSQKLYLNARVNNTYVYDPVVGDWIGRFPKPKPMVYNDCFYTLNTLPTPHGLVCWTGHGGLFKLDPAKREWQEVQRSGAKLPSAVVDSSTFVFDSNRDRLIFVRSDYGKKNDGNLHSLDLKTGEVRKSAPANAAALAALDLKGVDRAVYDPDHDLVLFSALLPGEADKPRRALAYDCAADKWLSLAISYEVGKDKRPAHPGGPGHSCGLLFDARRKIIWGIDTHDCRVYALRLDPTTADLKPIE
jgi:hypothetical protein